MRTQLRRKADGAVQLKPVREQPKHGRDKLPKVLNPTELVRVANLAVKSEIDAAVQNGVLLGQSREIGSTPTFIDTSPYDPQQKVAGFVACATLKDFLDRLMK